MPEPSVLPTQDQELLVERYRHLVRYVVDRLGVAVVGVFDHDDAMQAGMLGMLAAAAAYRGDRGASFESYAILRIRGAILDAVRTVDPVRRTSRDAARSIAATTSALTATLGHAPTDLQAAERAGMPVGRYIALRQAGAATTVSLDAAVREDAGEAGALTETLVDPNAVDPLDHATRREELDALIAEVDRLSNRNRRVIALYYRDELTLREIAGVLGVSESRACQIHRSALEGLRRRLIQLRSGPRQALGLH